MTLSKTKKIMIGVVAGLYTVCGIVATVGGLMNSQSGDKDAQETGQNIMIGALSAAGALTMLGCFCCCCGNNNVCEALTDAEKASRGKQGTEFDLRTMQYVSKNTSNIQTIA